MRKKIVAANWKMNNNKQESVSFINSLKNDINTQNVDVVICVPFVNLGYVQEEIAGTNIKLGAQNIYFEEAGAFTGEISPQMLKSFNVEYVIIGHSERRTYFNETCETVNKKVLKTLEHGMKPIICVGESLEERETNVTIELVRMQVKKALKNVSESDAENVVIAYEPIWAIGTGKIATKEQAQEVCFEIRKVLAEIYNENVANKIRIQYGGSVTADTASELFAMQDIDGGLIGSASLKNDFIKIVNY